MRRWSGNGAGNYEKPIEEANKAVELDPDHAFAYVNLDASYLFLNRLQDAENTIRKASERKLAILELLITRYYIAFFQHDQAEMDREAARAQGKSGAEDWMSHSKALVLARSGKLDLARRMSRRAVDVALQTGQKERAATYETGAATWEGFFGNARNAKQHAMAALNIRPELAVQVARHSAASASSSVQVARAVYHRAEPDDQDDSLRVGVGC